MLSNFCKWGVLIFIIGRIFTISMLFKWSFSIYIDFVEFCYCISGTFFVFLDVLCVPIWLKSISYTLMCYPTSVVWAFIFIIKGAYFFLTMSAYFHNYETIHYFVFVKFFFLYIDGVTWRNIRVHGSLL